MTSGQSGPNFPRPPLAPWLVAALFAPTALALWAISFGIVPLDAGRTRVAFQTIALLQLFVAFALYERWPPRDGEAARHGLALALAVFVIAQVSLILLARKAFADVATLMAAAVLLQHVVTIGLAEELWFRGLWMRATASRPMLAIFGGAAGFGLYHLHQGPAMMATAASLGVLFAVARWHGAPIWALALAHGAMNWSNSTLAPTSSWRFDPVLSRALFIALILAGAAALHWLASRHLTAKPARA